jgi:hypothetical protein
MVRYTFQWLGPNEDRTCTVDTDTSLSFDEAKETVRARILVPGPDKLYDPDDDYSEGFEYDLSRSDHKYGKNCVAILFCSTCNYAFATDVIRCDEEFQKFVDVWKETTLNLRVYVYVWITSRYQYGSEDMSLLEGFPRMVGNNSWKRCWIPSSVDRVCRRILSDAIFMEIALPGGIAWHSSSQRRHISCADILDIRFYVAEYLGQIRRAMQSDISRRMGLPNDVCAGSGSGITFTSGCSETVPVGIVLIVEPIFSKNVLNEPTLLRQLFDQMVIVRKKNEFGPCVGILTCGKYWLAARFPDDADTCDPDLNSALATTRIIHRHEGKELLQVLYNCFLHMSSAPLNDEFIFK